MTDADPAVPQEMAETLRKILDHRVRESIELRMGAKPVRPDASTGELLGALLDVRARLDRMEELLTTTLQLRGLAARQHTVFDIQVSNAWDQVAVRQRQAAIRDEYSSAQERAAAVNVEVLDLRRLERAAHANSRLCEEAVESIRLRLRGLQDVRQDILAIIRVHQFESTLER